MGGAEYHSIHTCSEQTLTMLQQQLPVDIYGVDLMIFSKKYKYFVPKISTRPENLSKFANKENNKQLRNNHTNK